jgi:hypothetical protein
MEPPLVDLWRRNHGANAREWSWMTKKPTASDWIMHLATLAFVASFNPTRRHDHSRRESGLSDHSPANLDLG